MMYDELVTALRACVDKEKGCLECPYYGKCMNTVGKHAAMIDAADAIEKLNKRINTLMNYIFLAQCALDRGADNEWARDVLEAAIRSELKEE